jgi:hypothetical protein
VQIPHTKTRFVDSDGFSQSFTPKSIRNAYCNPMLRECWPDTNQNAAIIDCKRGTGSQSIGAGMLCRLLPCRACSTRVRRCKTICPCCAVDQPAQRAADTRGAGGPSPPQGRDPRRLKIWLCHPRDLKFPAGASQNAGWFLVGRFIVSITDLELPPRCIIRIIFLRPCPCDLRTHAVHHTRRIDQQRRLVLRSVCLI